MKIFVSYRRQDSAAHTGRLSEALAARYGPKSVFLDFANISPGEDFRARVEAAVSHADAVLAVIGPRWLDAGYRDGERRLDDPDDAVRSELRTALALGKNVVPVLVDGAQVPPTNSLPGDLAALASLAAVSIGHSTWTDDFSILTRRLDGQANSGWTKWLPWRR